MARRPDHGQFMGVVNFISRKVERAQRLEPGSLLGATYIHCKRLLDNFEQDRCSTFARYAILHVVPSLTRDVTRERRAAAGLKHDGSERKHRTPKPDFVEAALPGELPPWWPMLSQRQKSIVLLTAEGVRPAKIARYVGISEAEVLAELAAVRTTLKTNRVPLCDVPSSLDDPGAESPEEPPDDRLPSHRHVRDLPPFG